MFQNYALFDELDARGNLRIALDHAPPGTAGLTDQLADMLADIDPDQAISACSGGQNQRLAIVRTVLVEPAGAAVRRAQFRARHHSSRRLVELIRDLCRTMGKPALIAVHHYEELLPLADRVLVMDPRDARLDALPPQAPAIEQALEEAAGLDAAAADQPAPSEAAASQHAAAPRPGPGTVRPLAQRMVPALRGGVYVAAVCLADHAAYIAAGAGITGFVTIWFGFNYYSYGGLLKSMLHDETVIGLGAVQCRVALPLICTLLFVARNSAVIAADIGNRVLTRSSAPSRTCRCPARPTCSPPSSAAS